MFKLILSGFVVCSTLACSGTPNTDSTDETGDPITLDNYIDELSIATCNQTINCEGSFGPQVPSTTECNAISDAVASAFPFLENEALYEIDSERATACFEKVRTDCDFEFNDDPDCAASVLGKLAEEECCDARGGCAADLYCLMTGGELGTCQEFRANEEACAPGEQCAQSLYCNQAGVCEALPAATEACAPGGRCAPSLFCDFLDTTCKTKLAAGANCGGADQCLGVCDLTRNQCIDAPFAGDPCEVTNDRCGASNTCIADEITAEGECVPWAREDEACDAAEIVAPPCANWGLVCNAESVCEEGPTVDADCTDADICFPVWDLYCKDVGGGVKTCFERVALDAQCSTADTSDLRGGCGLGLKCGANNTCEETVPLGTLCQ